MSQTLTATLRAECAWCGKTVQLTPSGKLYRHRSGKHNTTCMASRQTPVQADTYNTWREFLREHWRIGDAIPVSNAVLNTNPPDSLRDSLTYATPAIPPGVGDLEDELAFLQGHARAYIDRMYHWLFNDRGPK